MSQMKKNSTETGLEIAVIGMAGRFPGAGNLDEFWENLEKGKETISFFSHQELIDHGTSPELLDNPDYVRCYGVLEGKENFDSSFFGLSPREAEDMDPQIRLFLECSWEALEDAGYDPGSHKGAIGLYGGIGDGFAWRAVRVIKNLAGGAGQGTVHLLDTSLLLSTRVSHKLDLKGPSMTLYTACSTSLVAVHQACRALLTGECDMALAGAVSAQPIEKTGYLYQEGMILSPDGHCRAFDAEARGTVFGEGIGIVVLKRLKKALADNDTIKAVIKASAVNNDGTGKASFTAPGKKRITDVIRTGLKLARLAPENISFIEAHGSATSLGDAIEAEALKDAFNTSKKGFCAIGSVKSNIGHLDVAAATAGFLKTVLALLHRQIPPTLYFDIPNPTINFINSPFYVNTFLSPWEKVNGPDEPLRAGVCSFGIGGTNAFILLEEAPANTPHRQETGVPQLILLSARTDSALAKMTGNLVEYLKKNPGVNLADAAFTLQVGRKAFKRRRMVVCSSVDEAIEALSKNSYPLPEDFYAPDDLLRETGMAWLKGETIDWPEFYSNQPGFSKQKRYRISLPTYPFERQRYWIDGIGPDPLTYLFTSQGKVGPGPVENIEKPKEKEASKLYQRPVLSTPYTAPVNETEQTLVNIWQRFFGIERIGTHDDFFELGGDSLKAITVFTEIHKHMETKILVTQLFESPTIKGLADYIKTKGAGTDKYFAIEPVEEKEYYPLSSVQMRIYILQQIELDSTGYNTPLVFEIEGQLDGERMKNTFKQLIQRHESLRTSFELIEEKTVQRVYKHVDFEIEYDGSSIRDFVRPFDLSRAPLLRLGLIKETETRHILMVDMHHIITDGSSIGLLVREFMGFYSGESLPELRIQYKDYTCWQDSDKQKQAVKKQEAYWLKVFEGDIPILNLPLDYARPAIQSFAGSRTRFEIGREEAGALRDIALKEDATLFMVLLSLYNILLAKICGQDDIVVGTPIAGRSHADLQRVIGMLVNTLALRNNPPEENTFKAFLSDVRKNTLAAFENQDYLFEDLVDHMTLNVNRDVSRNPVFDTMFILQNYASQYDVSLQFELPGLTLKPYEYERGIAIFDLTLEAIEAENGTITCSFEFCTKLFKPETIDRFVNYFKKIVSFIAASPDRKISEIEILTEKEKEQILYQFNTTGVEYPEDKTVHVLFEEQAAIVPDRIALVEAAGGLAPLSSGMVSYKQLNKASDQMAFHLRQKGVGPDTVVGLMMQRSAATIISILAIMKAGGAYLPIDPAYPEERIQFMLADSGAEVLLTNLPEGHLLFNDQFNCQLSIVNCQLFMSAPNTLLHHSSFIVHHSGCLAYVIYTSGSTGRPKGVMLEHRNVLNLISYQYRFTNINFQRVLQFTTISFDVSFQEIFSTLLAGGTLFLIDEETTKNIPRLFEVINRNKIRTLFLPASVLKFVFNEQEYASVFPTGVDHIVTAGEQVIVTDRFRSYLKANHVYLHNHYGPAETHVVTALTLDPQSEIPTLPFIGKPLVNTPIYIVDRAFHLLPVGIAGELVIGGTQVGRGYLNNPEQTIEKFTYYKAPEEYPLSFSASQLLSFSLYRTGDLARWLPDGNIEFLGRIDHQVKIRGFRVEPGEIESRLMDIPIVKEAVVMHRDEPGGGKYLCAYVVPEQESKVEPLEIRNMLSKVLPDYMVPAYFVLMDNIPLTPNGKVNRKALPEPERDVGGDIAAPAGGVETKLAELWAEVLAVEKDRIGINANFFQLGGHSLKATLLTAKVHKWFHVDIPLGEMFKQPTIRGLAEYIRGAERERFAAIEPVEEKDYYPLSPAQKRLYIIQQMDPESPVYNMPSVMAAAGEIDKQRLEQTFRQLVRRHESFRTSFQTVNEVPVQRIHKDVTFNIECYDMKETPVEVIKDFVRPFDLSGTPLLRVGLAAWEQEKHLLLVDMHHIISDGISIRILVREFIRLYLGEKLPALRLQYKDCAQWQNSEPVQRNTEHQEAFWLKEFSDEVPVLNLPTDFPRPAVQRFEGDNFSFEIGKGETTALNQLAQEQGATLFMVLTAVFNILLSKLSSQEDIVIGTPIAGRRHADLQQVIGMLVNTLALRNFPKGEKTFSEFLYEVRTGTLKAFENQDCQFEDLVEKVAVNRDAGRNPLFDVMFALQNMGDGQPGETIGAPELNVVEYDFEKNVSRFDMTWNVIERDGRLSFDIEYSTRLFKEETIERFTACFKKAVVSVAANPGARISEIDIMPEGERERVLYNFNDTRTEYPRDKTIHTLFEEQARQIPDGIAIHRIYRTYMTYNNLNERSDQLSYQLQANGVSPGSIVGILVGPSLEMVIGILAILKAGGAYLPIDPDYPEERITYMLKDSGAKILLSEVSEVSGVSLPTHLTHLTHPTHLSYVIYTSGSTGEPKGVMVEHRGVVRLVKNTDYITFNRGDRILQTGAVTFDASTFEIWGALLNGLTLYVAPKEEILAPGRLKQIIRKCDIHIVWMTSALFNQTIEADIDVFSGLRYFLVGGDVVSPVHINRLREKHPHLKVINGYGPTENTTFSTTFLIDREYPLNIPIGKPIANSTAYILDKHGHLAPIGVPGELHVGGDGVARGYLNNPELTNSKFQIPNSKAPAGHPLSFLASQLLSFSLYRTGDLARWLLDGNIEFLGRMDTQVKIRGFRIELGEIENQLLKHPHVREAVVIAKDNEAGDKSLFAYIVPHSPHSPHSPKIKEFLSQSLPDYMIPSYFIPLAQIPLTTSGKVDRRALPGAGAAAVDKYIPPADEIERLLVDSWSGVLSIKKEKISTGASFFELGGHSLKAAVLTARIHKELDVNVPLSQIFRTPTITGLAKYIRGAVDAGDKFVSLEPVEEKEYYILSSAQKRLYVLQQMDLDSTFYNIPQVFHLDMEIDREKLQQTFRQLIRRHDSFRTWFETVNDVPVQRIHKVGVEQGAWSVEQGAWDSDSLHAPCSMPHASFVRPFDLSHAPLLRVGLIKLAKKKSILMVDMHHIISDGVSMEILVREFMALYRGEYLPELRLQYKDFSEWQKGDLIKRRIKIQEKYWLREFNENIHVLDLPFDYPRPEVQSFEGSTIDFEIGEQETMGLNHLALEQGATVYMVLLSLFNIFLWKLSGQEDIVIGSPVAARQHADLQGIIGMFVNTLPLRNFPQGEKTFITFLEEVKSRTVQAFENQEYPFEELVEKVEINRTASRNPLFDVMFALDNMSNRGEASSYTYDYQVSKFDLTLTAAEGDNRLWLHFEYCTRLFKEETIRRFIGYFERIVRAVKENPAVRIGEIEIMGEEEKKQILDKFNDTTKEIPKDNVFPDLFRQQVERAPDRTALTFENARLTYNELNKRANRLAKQLKDTGIVPDSIVGIMVERSLEMIISILAVLKAGGGYLPIDPEYPEERINYMLQDSGARILLKSEIRNPKSETNPNDSNSNDQNSMGTPVVLNFEHLNFEFVSNFDIRISDLDSSNLAYVIYTSGTTGRPKGVLVEHGNLMAYVSAFLQEFKPGPGDIAILEASFAFDAFVEEVYPILLTGGKLCIANKYDVMDAHLLEAFIIRNNITIISCSPLLLNEINRFADLKGLPVHTFISGADVLKREYIDRLLKIRTVYNVYGPTETTVCAAYYKLSDDIEANIPIGKPISNYQVYILGVNSELQPIGVPGELCISGAGVARGYLNNPELTNAKFQRGWHPLRFSASQLLSFSLYRTGDLGRWLPTGDIQFLGRIDRQVKIRGFRIELEEIESQLMRHPEISRVVVIQREDEGKDNYLCAYVVPAAGNEPSMWELKEFLSGQLADYMIPSYFVSIDSLPLTVTGKINPKALPEPLSMPLAELEVRNDFRDPVEMKLAALWSEVLGVEEKGINRETNFFELGGHSLKATVLTGKIHKELGVRLPLVEIFKTPTIKGTAEYVRSARAEVFSGVEPVEEREYYPLSSAQKRLYVLQQMELESTVYNMPEVAVLNMTIDMEKLQRAARQLIRRHESFRTSFITINEEPVQRIHKNVEFELEYSDSFISQFVRPFDLSCAPLLRMGLIKLEEGKSVLMADMHHIISDGVSMDILNREFLLLYEGKEPAPLWFQYKDYAQWQNSQAVKEKLKDQEDYWLNEFNDDIPVLNLPFDYPRPAVQSFEGDYFRFTINREETAILKQMVLDRGVTLFMILMSVFDILLYKLSGQEDIVIGTPVAGRQHADLQGIIGILVNTLVLRHYPTGHKTFKEFLQEVKTRTLRAFENQDYQFEELVEKVAVGRDPGRNPLFDVVFTWQDWNEGMEEEQDSTSNTYEGRVARFDMTWFALESNGRIRLGIEYCTKLFKLGTIERFSGYFKKIVASVIGDPNQTISEIEIISPEEKHRLLYDFNQRDMEYPGDKAICELFEEQVQRTPDSIAVQVSHRTYRTYMTYKQLNRKSTQLAHYLHRQGAAANHLVGIMVDRSLEMIVGILGILKAGCAYVPLDPNAPEERITTILEECRVKILLGKDRGAAPISEVSEVSGNIEVIDLSNVIDRNGGSSAHQNSPTHLTHLTHPTHLCYVIFTSGSTGKPKGVPISHANLSPLLFWGYRHLDLHETDRVIQNLSYYFDWSVWEIFITLTTGAGLFVVSEDLLLNPVESAVFMREMGITVLHVTPIQYRYYLAAGQKLETLRYLFIGAEAMSVDLVERSFLSVNARCRVFNMYGPTEATIIASVLEVERTGLEAFRGLSSVPIGRPVANTEFFILDRHLKMCPVNVTGELFIGGAGLAAGYLNNPELTAEKFNRSYKSYRTYYFYKTGDLARWLPDGNVEFLGRIDFQVKIRGYRIELGEIESRLMTHPAVKEAVVLAREKENTEKYLCAYIVPHSPYSPNLKEHLSRSLPDYMIPDYFVTIDHIPLNPNGKVDRKALPEPGIEASDKYEAPRSEMQRKLVEIWSEVLAVDSEIIGIGDDFFERGGHSLKAAIMVSKIQKEFHIAVPLVEVFKTPTVKHLAEYISENKTGKEIVAVEDENLVLLRQRGDSANYLFFIHDGTGGVDGYIEFCSHLNNTFTCWGIRAGELENNDQTLTIEALASSYIKKIRKIQPYGPYSIAGWSIGGSIAFEMVRQLEEAGETPGFLALIDAPPPQKMTSRRKRILAQAPEVRQDVIQTLVEARDRYYPEGKSNTTAHFFKASRSRIPNKNLWSDYFKKPVTFYEMNGDHFSILKMPDVAAFGKLFDNVVNQQS